MDRRQSLHRKGATAHDPCHTVPCDLDDLLQHVLLRLTRHAARYGHRMLQADGRLSDLYVSIREVQSVLGADRGDEPPPAPLSDRAALPTLEEADAAVDEHAQGLAPATDSALGRLQTLFGLTDGQLLLLIAAAAPALSLDISRLYTFAWADFSRKRPSVGFLAELMADGGSAAEVRQQVAEFGDDSPLVARRLLVVGDAGPWGGAPGGGDPGPLLHRAVSVPDSVIAELTGRTRLPPPWVELPVEPAPDPADLFGPEGAEPLIKRLADIGPSAPRLLLIGPAGSGRRSVLAAHTGAQPLIVELSRLVDSGDVVARLSEAAQEALLRGRTLLVRGDGVVDDADRIATHGPDLARVLDDHPGALAITARRPAARLHRWIGRLVELVLPSPTTDQQRTLWQRALAAAGCATDELPDELVRRFDLPPGAIADAVEDARARAVLLDGGTTSGTTPALTRDDLVHAVRRRADHALSEIAEPFDTSLGWDDVVLPETTLSRLQEILSHARHREQVLDHWGFRKKLSYGQGLSCLFAGPPGTGKTMLAGVLARELGREIYRVDVSRITSKWVGETEKNLARVFEEAERAQVILLFDEADSLFASRTEVKSSNDRFANMQVNFLLQRMESYDGMTILTTNFEASIDEAFKRRIRFWVTFPFPDAAQRTSLWRSMLPEVAPVDPEIPESEWDALGEEFELSGGSIKNAALRAAFYAARKEDEQTIVFDHLWDAATAEMRDMGKLIRD